MKIPPRTRRPIQMIARRRLKGLDCIMFDSCYLSGLTLSLAEKLVEKLLEDFVAHDTGIGVGLTLAMKHRRWRLIDVVHLAEREILIDCRVKCSALDERANLGQVCGREHASDSAVHIAVLFPFFLVLKEGLFDGLELADLSCGAAVAGRDARMRMHGQGKIAMDQVNLANADVVIHELVVRGGVKSLASGTLKITENFHDNRSGFRAEGRVRVNVRDGT